MEHYSQEELDSALLALVEDCRISDGLQVKLDLLLSEGASLLTTKHNGAANVLQLALQNKSITSGLVRHLLERCPKQYMVQAIDYVTQTGMSTYHFALTGERLDMLDEFLVRRMQMEPKLVFLDVLLPHPGEWKCNEDHNDTSEQTDAFTVETGLIVSAANYLTDDQFLMFIKSMLIGLKCWHGNEICENILDKSSMDEHKKEKKLVLECMFRAAADYGHLKSVEKLIQAGTDVNAKPQVCRWHFKTALQTATSRHITALTLLLKHYTDDKCCITNVSKNSQCDDGHTTSATCGPGSQQVSTSSGYIVGQQYDIIYSNGVVQRAMWDGKHFIMVVPDNIGKKLLLAATVGTNCIVSFDEK